MLLVLRNHLLFSSVLSCPAALVSLTFLVVVSHDLNHGVLKYFRSRRDRTGPIWYRKDCHILDFNTSKD